MPDDQFDRVPPQDIDAEMSVLGSMMLTTEAANVVSEMLRGQDFYQPSHETIFNTIVELNGRAEPADAITVAGELKRTGVLSKVGGAAYLHTLIASVPTAANAAYYARIVRERAIMRRLVTAGTRVVQLGYADAGGDVDEIVDQAQAEVYAVSDGRETSDYVSMNQMSSDVLNTLEEIEKNKGKLNGVPTGFTDLDELTQGLHGGQMIIVAARPAMGKSTLALDFCRSASMKHGITSLIFSLEMSSQEIAMRMLSAESGVRLSKMQAGKMSDVDWRKVAETTSRMSEAPLYVDDSANITISEIRSKCRRLKQQENLGLVVIDYLQLMTSGRQVESRQQEVSAMSRNLKLLAKDLDIPVIAVSQLNRNSEGRTDRKPMMSDLRESGSLEQDADIIILLHRPDYYDKEDRPGEADIIVAKHRAGATATVTALFQGDMARFVNYTGRPEPGVGGEYRQFARRAALCARGRRPARSPSAPRASLGASSRSPARPCRHPRAPQHCPPAPFTPAGLRQPPIGRYLVCSAGVPGAFGPGRPPDLRPPRGLPARSPPAPRASLGASSRSPARPCRPRGVLQSGGTWCAPLVFWAPSGPAAREIATRELRSEWSISKPARALRTLRRPLHRRGCGSLPSGGAWRDRVVRPGVASVSVRRARQALSAHGREQPVGAQACQRHPHDAHRDPTEHRYCLVEDEHGDEELQGGSQVL